MTRQTKKEDETPRSKRGEDTPRTRNGGESAEIRKTHGEVVAPARRDANRPTSFDPDIVKIEAQDEPEYPANASRRVPASATADDPAEMAVPTYNKPPYHEPHATRGTTSSLKHQEEETKESKAKKTPPNPDFTLGTTAFVNVKEFALGMPVVITAVKDHGVYSVITQDSKHAFDVREEQLFTERREATTEGKKQLEKDKSEYEKSKEDKKQRMAEKEDQKRQKRLETLRGRKHGDSDEAGRSARTGR